MPNAAKGLFVNYPLTEGLSWRDRLLQWFRWITPVSKDSKTEDMVAELAKEDQTTREEQLEIRDEAEVALPKKSMKIKETTLEERPRDVAFWSDRVSVQSSALMGTVLYAQTQPSTKDSQEAPSFANATRSFSTAVPGISRLLATASTSSAKSTDSAVMRFLPNPFSSPSAKQSPIGAVALSAFPPIEFRFAVDPQTKVMGLNFIHAILSNENSDLMLPDSPMDIRFQQKSTARLHCTKRSLPQGIAKFLEASNLSLDYSRGGLQTPPLLHIPIAAHICTKDALKLLGSDKKYSQPHDVEYFFAGLEIRKTIAMEFKGWRLLYTSVEAGKAGGRRGELRLRPARIVESDDPQLETEEAFLETAFQLAGDSHMPISSRRVLEKLVRMVKMCTEKDGVDSDRAFRYFAKRPSILLEWQDGSKIMDEESGEGLADEAKEAEI